MYYLITSKRASTLKVFKFLFFLVFLFISGCATLPYIEKKDGQYQLRPLSEREKTGNLSIRDKFPDYNTRNISDNAKIFLVAAGSDSANFLQEIVGQRRFLLSLGYKEDILFTPRYLKNILGEMRNEVKKYIILQGCYTGGFASTNNMILAQDTLKSLPNICLITASRYDRPSFGCEPGTDRTYFGGVFIDMLEAQNSRLDTIAWNILYKRIKEGIEQIESKKKIKAKHRSLPSFFNNIGM